eukprot:655030-Pleurochrysis_carterae.AAC.1
MNSYGSTQRGVWRGRKLCVRTAVIPLRTILYNSASHTCSSSYFLPRHDEAQRRLNFKAQSEKRKVACVEFKPEKDADGSGTSNFEEVQTSRQRLAGQGQ